MNKLKLLFPLIVLLLNSGCASMGPTVLIETPEPAEDFVVLCSWHDDPFLNLHGGRKQTDSKIYVMPSGEEVNCGVSVWGGDGSVLVMHPLYVTDGGCIGAGCNQKSGDVLRVVPKTKLQYLDELKEKFEAGYWDNFKWPGSLYASAVLPVCGFPHQYIGYYLQEKREIDFVRFKSKYDEPMYQCLKSAYAVLEEYHRGFPKDTDARQVMDKKWIKLKER